MPVKPAYEWEQTDDEVLLRVTIKGFKKEAIDVFLSDVWVKVNAAPTYLLALDLLHPIDVVRSTHYVDPVDRTCLRLRLRKQQPGVWSDLCISAEACDANALRERRAAAAKRAEEDYNRRLQERVGKREEEKRRMTEEQWEVEKAQRRLIEGRVKEEREAAEADLYSWEDEQKQQQHQERQQQQQQQQQQTPASGQAPRCPADIAVPHVAKADETAPSVRHTDTIVVPVEFTPKLATMPTRSRGEEEYYRRSRYKPTRIEDSPMFWKERADKHYQHREWKAAADAYTESIKRDGAFLTCVSNRAACFIHLFEYKRAIEDCTLALTMLSNTPASELTQERYRHLMVKLHSRRGAAYCWGNCYDRGVEDLRVAAAYCDPSEDADVLADYKLVEAYMKERGLIETRDPLAAQLQEASALYYRGNYAGAAAIYRDILQTNPYEVRAHNNLGAVLIQQGLFKEALEETSHVLRFCQEVADALSCPGALSTNLVDSDEDDEVSGEEVDEVVRQRKAAVRKVGEQSGHVYALLKACVRGAAAHCGLKEYRKALALLEQAVRITPYDDDLQDDYNRVAEKLRLETLVAASAGGP
ncbi:TPR Domain containing protein [Trypanosoma grayi]|uniref:TPR Domain containing protein n=1 Tax=Trypanosoma grayi TaxID=71804 RepID=UPI0004F42AC4|nr:TPR Domain containing protein [Trypanosoma grayi]KEG08518.1 TPR Domain containing protein [Trypanosoma grayi]